MIAGHRNPRVEAAAAARQAAGDCTNGPGPVTVELAELLVAIIPCAGWAMLSDIGTDAAFATLRAAYGAG